MSKKPETSNFIEINDIDDIPKQKYILRITLIKELKDKDLEDFYETIEDFTDEENIEIEKIEYKNSN